MLGECPGGCVCPGESSSQGLVSAAVASPDTARPFQGASHSRQGCPAEEKLHLKHTEHQQTQSTEDEGYGLEPFFLHGIASGGIQGIIPVLQQVELF